MMASLRHPSIVMYLGVCLDPPAVVTEYCARGEVGGWGGVCGRGRKEVDQRQLVWVPGRQAMLCFWQEARRASEASTQHGTSALPHSDNAGGD